MSVCFDIDIDNAIHCTRISSSRMDFTLDIYEDSKTIDLENGIGSAINKCPSALFAGKNVVCWQFLRKMTCSAHLSQGVPRFYKQKLTPKTMEHNKTYMGIQRVCNFIMPFYYQVTNSLNNPVPFTDLLFNALRHGVLRCGLLLRTCHY